MKRLPTSSDECVESFFKTTMDGVDYLVKKGQVDTAFNLLFNQKDLQRNWQEIMTLEMMKTETEHFKQILISSAQKKEYPIDKTKTDKTMEKIAEVLYAKYGDDVLLLQNPLSQPDKKLMILKISADMYNKIFNLPKPEKYPLLRSFIVN